MATEGIFCLEAEWDADLRSRDTVRPVLEFFANTTTKQGVPLIYRQVLSKEDISICIRRWQRSRYKEYGILYLAAHGKPGKLDLWNDESLSLEELATKLEGSCEGKVVLIGSCAMLQVSESRLEKFLKTTKARCLAGYTKRATWTYSTALDLIILEALREYNSPKNAWKWLEGNCKGLLERYGFIMRFQ